MKFFTRARGFVQRILRGEDVVLIAQSPEGWNAQYTSGTWEYALDDLPNTRFLYEYIRSYAEKENRAIRVLDVGCGNGALGALVSPHENISYVGLDFSKDALEQAKVHVPHGTFVQADATNPPNTLGIFDCIVFNEVLYYTNPLVTLPRYAPFSTSRTQILVSIVRFQMSIRSFLVWKRILPFLKAVKRKSLRGAKKHQKWDIVIATYANIS